MEIVGGQAQQFHELIPMSPLDELTTFIALLFLNYDEKITIWQDDFPGGEVFIKIDMPEELFGQEIQMPLKALA